jgi:hypothetical protein
MKVLRWLREHNCPWVELTALTPLTAGTWRCCSGFGSTTARGTIGRANSLRRKDTWSCCSGRWSTVLHLLNISRERSRRFGRSQRCAAFRGKHMCGIDNHHLSIRAGRGRRVCYERPTPTVQASLVALVGIPTRLVVYTRRGQLAASTRLVLVKGGGKQP